MVPFNLLHRCPSLQGVRQSPCKAGLCNGGQCFLTGAGRVGTGWGEGRGREAPHTPARTEAHICFQHCFHLQSGGGARPAAGTRWGPTPCVPYPRPAPAPVKSSPQERGIVQLLANCSSSGSAPVLLFCVSSSCSFALFRFRSFSLFFLFFPPSSSSFSPGFLSSTGRAVSQTTLPFSCLTVARNDVESLLPQHHKSSPRRILIGSCVSPATLRGMRRCLLHHRSQTLTRK